jgi:TRAP-type mannitol/chloroaromatic compound transport system permease small subunit
MSRLADLLDGINSVIGRLVRWLVLFMMCVQFCIVLLRYVFGVSDIALNESVLYMHAAVFMLAAGYTLLEDGHVRVDIYYARLSQRGRALIDLLGHIFLLIPAVTVLLYWSWPTVRNAWRIMEGAISVGGIPASFLLKSLIPAFCILLLVQSISCLLRAVITIRSGDNP